MPIPKAHLPKLPELLAFGEAVRRHRKALGYSQESFGDECGIDRSYMGGIERGEHNLALVNILKIINALKLQPSEFFRDLDADRQKDFKLKMTLEKERSQLMSKYANFPKNHKLKKSAL